MWSQEEDGATPGTLVSDNNAAAAAGAAAAAAATAVGDLLDLSDPTPAPAPAAAATAAAPAPARGLDDLLGGLDIGGSGARRAGLPSGALTRPPFHSPVVRLTSC